jgi:hypothetical protein
VVTWVTFIDLSSSRILSAGEPEYNR